MSVHINVTGPDGEPLGKWITDNDGTHRPVGEPLTFRMLAETNLRRAKRWHPGWPDDGWSGADWANAAAGEMGEACNVVKKLRRQETAKRGAVDPDYETLRGKLGDEIADTIIYLDLLAAFYGIDLNEAIPRKFNAISEREGMPERLGP